MGANMPLEIIDFETFTDALFALNALAEFIDEWRANENVSATASEDEYASDEEYDGDEEDNAQ